MMNHEKVIICKGDIGPDDNVKKTAIKHEWDEKEDSALILFISVSALCFSIYLITFFFFLIPSGKTLFGITLSLGLI